jgi:TetR/AcrR family transcriptional repressor of nem operon
MDVAQQMVLRLGLSGTSVEKVIAEAGVTRGTFFYHFKTKHALAASLIERWADQDRHHFHDFMARAEQLARDPLQQLLLFVGLFIEMAEQLEEPFPGCLYASYCCQSGAISPEIMARMAAMMRFWRQRAGHEDRAGARPVSAAHPGADGPRGGPPADDLRGGLRAREGAG